MMGYTELLKKLRGRPAKIEIGDPKRPAVEVVNGFVWDLFFDDQILLVVRFGEVFKAGLPAVNPATPVPGQSAAAPQVPQELHREYFFKWIKVDSIVSLETDVYADINMKQRIFDKPRPDPLYTDNLVQWSVINNALSRYIQDSLRKLGLEPSFAGLLLTDDNLPLPAPEPAKPEIVLVDARA